MSTRRKEILRSLELPILLIMHAVVVAIIYSAFWAMGDPLSEKLTLFVSIAGAMGVIASWLFRRARRERRLAIAQGRAPESAEDDIF